MADWKRMTNRSKAAVLDFYGIPHGIKAGKPRQPSGKPLEAGVIAAVSELLEIHPRVLFACRQNSGGASYEHSSGEYKPIFFYKILRGREYLQQQTTITDFWGLLDTGMAFAIEAKRPGWKFHFSDERARRQHAFINLIKKSGGVGGFVTSVEEAQAILA